LVPVLESWDVLSRRVLVEGGKVHTAEVVLESCKCVVCLGRKSVDFTVPRVVVSAVRSTDVLQVKDLESTADFWVRAHNQVAASGLQNFQGCRIPVRSGLHIDRWRFWSARSGCSDEGLVDLLEFGWPLGFTGDSLPTGGSKNHSGAEVFSVETEAYLVKEKECGAVIGPFVKNPLVSKIVVSPINSIPKRSSTGRRFVSDLSFPRGESVNDGIDLSCYLGDSAKITFPTVDDFTGLIRRQGKGALIFKKDLSRAYRQFFLDPLDIRYQGFKWRGGFYLDCSLVMGCKSAAMMCQRATTAVTCFLDTQGVFVVSYLDDFAGCASPEDAEASYSALGSMLQELGLQESLPKAREPATRMEFLGVTFDTVSQTLEVTPSRLQEIKELLLVWDSKRSASRKEIQSLVGKLQFTARCVPAGRLFISRMLDLLRGLKSQGHRRRVSGEFRKDLLWWSRFIDSFSGISMMLDQQWLSPDTIISTDACLTGGGGWTEGEYFGFVFPGFVQDKNWHINTLELLVLMVALRLWSSRLKGHKVKVFCDNSATVSVINSGRCKDTVMLGLLREVAFLCTTGSCMVKAVHLPGVENRLADGLSRRSSLSSLARDELNLRLRGKREVQVEDSMFLCNGGW